MRTEKRRKTDEKFETHPPGWETTFKKSYIMIEKYETNTRKKGRAIEK